MDIIKELGVRGVGSYLKRIVEYMLNEVKSVYREFGIEIEPSWLPFFVAIGSKNGISIKEIAELTNVTHSAVSQAVNNMKSKELVEAKESSEDKRIQLIYITQKGRDEIMKLMPVCDTIKSVVEKRFSDTGYDILDVIEKLENEVRRDSVSNEVIELIRNKKENIIKIYDENIKYRDEYFERNMEKAKEYSKMKCIVAEKNGVYAGIIFYEEIESEIRIKCEEILNAEEEYEIHMALVHRIIKIATERGSKNISAEIEISEIKLINIFFKSGFEADSNIEEKIVLVYVKK